MGSNFWRATWAIWRKDVLTWLRQPTNIAATFLPPLLFLLGSLRLHWAEVYKTSNGRAAISRSARNGFRRAGSVPVMASTARRLPPMLPMIP